MLLSVALGAAQHTGGSGLSGHAQPLTQQHVQVLLQGSSQLEWRWRNGKGECNTGFLEVTEQTQTELTHTYKHRNAVTKWFN